eukprot:m.37574 g.37574  ORF g.37574 m.37574 type:complete len:85 (+) comp10113_c0_seq3:1705-1959(+)
MAIDVTHYVDNHPQPCTIPNINYISLSKQKLSLHLPTHPYSPSVFRARTNTHTRARSLTLILPFDCIFALLIPSLDSIPTQFRC